MLKIAFGTSGFPCEIGIYCESNVEKAIDSFCKVQELSLLKSIFVFAWTSRNVISDAHILNDFTDECESYTGCIAKWGIAKNKDRNGTMLFVIYTTK